MQLFPTFRFIAVVLLTAGCAGKVGNTSANCQPGATACAAGGSTSADSGLSTCGTGGTVDNGFVHSLDYCNGLLSGEYCSATPIQASMRAANVLLVVGAPGSMNERPTPTEASSKWDQLYQGLRDVLVPLADDVSFGLELFPDDPIGIDPSNPDSACAVPTGDAAINVGIGRGTATVMNILSVLGSYTPAGGAPVSKALQQAHAYFTEGSGQCFRDSAWVLLVTDSAPNCNGSIQCGADTCIEDLTGACNANPEINCCDTNSASDAAAKANYGCLDDDASITQIENLRAIGVFTYVVGLPGSESFAATLDAMANAGGLANPDTGPAHYTVSSSNFAQDLRAALKGIAAPLIRTCDFKLHDSPGSAAETQVAIDCSVVPLIPGDQLPLLDAETTDGYYIDYSQSPAHMVLTGKYCSEMMAMGAVHVDVMERCLHSL